MMILIIVLYTVFYRRSTGPLMLPRLHVSNKMNCVNYRNLQKVIALTCHVEYLVQHLATIKM